MASAFPPSAVPGADAPTTRSDRGQTPAIGWWSWGVSLAVHFLFMVSLGLAVPARPSRDGAIEAPQAGIVLASRSGESVRYWDQSALAAGMAAASTQAVAGEQSALPTASEQPIVAVAQSPSGLVAGLPPGDGVPRAGAWGAAGASGAGALRGQDGAAETELFGLRGRGTRFVYVFDRSASMEGAPLAAAKRELIASLQHLQGTHQFQIIFYNQQPRIMSLRGGPPQMVFADEAGKRLAASFVGSIFADGGTDHMQALAMALRLAPDVLFFLTDADEPQLHTDDFRRIRSLNRGTVIHAVEFGVGPPQYRESFLARLAAENGGQHTYIDVTRLGR
jgi:hypothetical protein